MGSSVSFEPGEQRFLKKPTFLFKGIFVLQGSPVLIQKVEGESIHVLYRDKEGFEHVIPGLKKEDLE
ncbi:MAG: hypothetical protein F9K24_05615 [Leptonema illini]|jgi:hypothetical protein|uniref:Uncharacterized protein n=2 Tax=Leptonema illini TaxID=183 RepID=H2CF43_9LEPT|nr:hypothetical protein Lepil_0945 [Leptonema illini DSM 21528]KAB2933944.1 MAG: hypothetical protein F9K24_05615 [Leptonema illini]